MPARGLILKEGNCRCSSGEGEVRVITMLSGRAMEMMDPAVADSLVEVR
jgi:hypothetical protein